MKYHLTYKLIEGAEDAAKTYCEEANANATPYQRRKYPAHYTPYHIENNYGPGDHWDGWIVWYHYKVD